MCVCMCVCMYVCMCGRGRSRTRAKFFSFIGTVYSSVVGATCGAAATGRGCLSERALATQRATGSGLRGVRAFAPGSSGVWGGDGGGAPPLTMKALTTWLFEVYCVNRLSSTHSTCKSLSDVPVLARGVPVRCMYTGVHRYRCSCCAAAAGVDRGVP